jgi:hypothetical protein
MSKKNKMACVVQSDPRERAFVVLGENNECDRSVVVDKKIRDGGGKSGCKRSSKEHQKMMHCTNLEGDPKNRA